MRLSLAFGSLLWLATLGLPQAGCAQAPDSASWVSPPAQGPPVLLKLNYLSPAVSTLSLFLEMPTATSNSWQFGFAYGTDGEAQGVMFTTDLRLYVGERKMNGFFIGPYGRLISMWEEQATSTSFNSTVTVTQNLGILGLAFGGQWIFKNKVSLDVFGGPGYVIGLGGTADEGFLGLWQPGYTLRFGSTIGLVL